MGGREVKCTSGGIAPLRRLASLSLGLGLVIAASALGAQQPAAPAAKKAPAASSQKPPATSTPKPRSGAQVQAGTSTGVDTDTRLMNMLADHEFTRLEGELDALPPWQAQYYHGVLANRNHNEKKSIELLEPLVESISATGNVLREKVLRRALAEDYLRLGNWAKAAEQYDAIEKRLGSKLSSDEQDELEMVVKMVPLARDHPPMTMETGAPFVVSVSKNPLGLTDVPVFVDARPQDWMFDPTLPFNLISRSHAREAGLKVSDESVVIHTLRGRTIKVHATLVPRLTIGGQLTLRNMTAYVFEDKDYYFPQTKYQVGGALGYSAVEAMGSVTITDSNRLYMDMDKQESAVERNDKVAGGVRFFLDGDQVILALGGSNEFGPGRGNERMYAIDAGGQQTYLTSRFYDEHTNDFTGLKMELFTLLGLPNMTPVPSYTAETVPLAVGKTTIQFHFMPVLTQPIGAAAVDDVYGVLGVDALDQLGSYTFDYRTMTFSIRLSEARD
jgi:hypothetical protein